MYRVYLDNYTTQPTTPAAEHNRHTRARDMGWRPAYAVEADSADAARMMALTYDAFTEARPGWAWLECGFAFYHDHGDLPVLKVFRPVLGLCHG